MCKYLFPLVTLIILPGCASTEVNYNAIDIANTYDSLLYKQVIFNVVKSYNDQYSVPAYVRIATQSAQTTDGFNPNFSLPFTAQSTVMQNAASVFTGKSLQTAGSGLSLQIQANRQQNYTLSPVVDPDQLRRIRSIYQYVTGHLSNFDFESDYPIIETSSNAGGPTPSTTVISSKVAGQSLSVTIGSGKSKTADPTFVRRTCLEPENTGCNKYGFITVRPDKTFISPPGCVMCNYGHHRDGAPENVFLLEKNKKLVGPVCKNPEQSTLPCIDVDNTLFFYRPGEGYDSEAVSLQSNNFDTLRVKGQVGLQAFYELVLFTQEAASQGTGSPSSGGQSEGRKTEPLQQISAPGLSLVAP